MLRLEKNPTDQTTLEEVFRGAHSLKGGAGMLGLRNIEQVAHGFEDVLNAARQGKVVLSSEAIDQLCKQLDTMRQFVDEAVSDTPGDVTIANALKPAERRRLDGAPAASRHGDHAKASLRRRATPGNRRDAGHPTPQEEADSPLPATISPVIPALIRANRSHGSARSPFWTLPHRHHACGTPEVGCIDEAGQ